MKDRKERHPLGASFVVLSLLLLFCSKQCNGEQWLKPITSPSCTFNVVPLYSDSEWQTLKSQKTHKLSTRFASLLCCTLHTIVSPLMHVIFLQKGNHPGGIQWSERWMGLSCCCEYQQHIIQNWAPCKWGLLQSHSFNRIFQFAVIPFKNTALFHQSATLCLSHEPQQSPPLFALRAHRLNTFLVSSPTPKVCSYSRETPHCFCHIINTLFLLKQLSWTKINAALLKHGQTMALHLSAQKVVMSSLMKALILLKSNSSGNIAFPRKTPRSVLAKNGKTHTRSHTKQSGMIQT